MKVFPCETEKATEVTKTLLREIGPQFGLPWSLQGDNAPSFTAQITQQVAQTHKIKYFLHIAWHPQSPGTVEKANHNFKRYLTKMRIETQENWVTLLQIGLLGIRTTPQERLELSPFELIYGWPLPLTYPQSQTKVMLHFSLDTRLVHKTLNKHANKVLSKPDPKEIQNSLQVNPRELVYLK